MTWHVTAWITTKQKFPTLSKEQNSKYELSKIPAHVRLHDDDDDDDDDDDGDDDCDDGSGGFPSQRVSNTKLDVFFIGSLNEQMVIWDDVI